MGSKCTIMCTIVSRPFARQRHLKSLGRNGRPLSIVVNVDFYTLKHFKCLPFYVHFQVGSFFFEQRSFYHNDLSLTLLMYNFLLHFIWCGNIYAISYLQWGILKANTRTWGCCCCCLEVGKERLIFGSFKTRARRHISLRGWGCSGVSLGFFFFSASVSSHQLTIGGRGCRKEAELLLVPRALVPHYTNRLRVKHLLIFNGQNGGCKRQLMRMVTLTWPLLLLLCGTVKALDLSSNSAGRQVRIFCIFLRLSKMGIYRT